MSAKLPSPCLRKPSITESIVFDKLRGAALIELCGWEKIIQISLGAHMRLTALRAVNCYKKEV